jgi:hypothetical protein
MGDHIYDMHDAVERKEFEDAVVVEIREVDGHFQRKLKGPNRIFFLLPCSAIPVDIIIFHSAVCTPGIYPI